MRDLITTSLSRDHNRKAFTCGVEALDRYLRELAFQDIKRHLAGCFVALDAANEIAGYYTLAAISTPLDSLPADLVGKVPYRSIPAMLIGRLAVARKHQGKGFGRALVIDAVIRTKGFGIGPFGFIVDAKDAGAVAFYKANGFTLVPSETRRMFLPMTTALDALVEDDAE